MTQDGTTTGSPRKTIAILGGGLGGLAAAYELTNQDRWYERHRIDIYQKGWRLGGKGASGRGEGGRIEEHGLHCFWGFYDNAFGMLRDCYGDAGRTSGPLRSVDDAFIRLDGVHFIDRIGERWCRYEMKFPDGDERPGTGPRLTEMSVAALGARFLQQVRAVLMDHGDVARRFAAALTAKLDGSLQQLETSLQQLVEAWTTHASGAPVPVEGLTEGLLERLTGATDAPPAEGLMGMPPNPDDEYRRSVILQAVKFAFFMFKGLVADGVPRSLDDFSRLDGRDLREWLEHHGAPKEVRESVIVRGFYDASFCFPDGDFANGNLAAGVSLRAILLMGFAYKGSFMWKMRAGMGDVVFAPLYEALVQRGLKADRALGVAEGSSLAFHFFHKVSSLSLDAEEKNVDAIAIDVQARVKGHAPYQPLIECRQLPCWPAEPLYDQLVDPGTLRAHDLESDWSTLGGTRRTLRRGADFDVAVLAIPVAALRTIARDLIDASPAWKNMVEQVKTVRTQSFQVWLTPTDAQRAWQDGIHVMTDVYKDPFNSVADMYQTLEFEDWAAGERPGGVLYFSTAMPDDAHEPTHPDDDYQSAQDRLVLDQAHEWLTQWQEGIMGWLGPKYDPGAYRSWFSRAAINADERYTLSVAGSTTYRLRPGGSGFDNLFLAGDWTKSPLDLGCAENATMSGLEAARAIIARAVQPDATTPRGSVEYVDYPGMPIYPPPYRQRGITLCQFVLEADSAKLQQVLDRHLNPAAGEHSFRATGKWVLLQTGHIAANSSPPPNDVYGTGSETSASFLVPCVRWRGWGGPAALPIEAGFFAPFVFVDHPLSVIAGREVLGMAKHLAQFEGTMPDALDQTVVSTMALRKLGPDSPVEPLPLLRVRRAGGAGTEAAPHAFPGGIRQALERAVGAMTRGGEELVRGLFSTLVDERPSVRLFSLRQLRDVHDPARAVWREVTSARMRLGHVELRPMPGAHTIEIEPLASHPIAPCLGLAGGPLSPIAQAKLFVDDATLEVER